MIYSHTFGETWRCWVFNIGGYYKKNANIGPIISDIPNIYIYFYDWVNSPLVRLHQQSRKHKKVSPPEAPPGGCTAAQPRPETHARACLCVFRQYFSAPRPLDFLPGWPGGSKRSGDDANSRRRVERDGRTSLGNPALDSDSADVGCLHRRSVRLYRLRKHDL